jgi:hypothetical protein
VQVRKVVPWRHSFEVCTWQHDRYPSKGPRIYHPQPQPSIPYCVAPYSFCCTSTHLMSIMCEMVQFTTCLHIIITHMGLYIGPSGLEISKSYIQAPCILRPGHPPVTCPFEYWICRKISWMFTKVPQIDTFAAHHANPSVCYFCFWY